ncbi:unnamed protein product, partial [Porites evermanni]
KEKLGYQALISQIEAGLTKGYSDKEVVSAVVRAVQPGLQLTSYLETMVDLTLPRLRKILRFHFHERNVTELYQLLTNIAQQPNEDPQSFFMRALIVRQKIISASKESDSGIKYDASSVQSLFLHAVETGLADETIRAKIRPLTQNPKVADEDLIGAVSLAISAEAERSNKFNLTSKGKSVKVSAIESAAESKKELQKDQQVLATLKVVQAELATMKAEVQNLREAASNQKVDPTMPSHAGNGVEQGHLVAKSVGGRGKVTDAHIATSVVACTILHATVRCQSVRYCSVRCQKAHWPKHKVLCKAIKELSERGSFKEKGLGDAQDSGVYASHISPRQQERIAKLVAKKCSVKCYLDEKPTEALWDTGAQVSIVSADFLKNQLPAVQIRDIEQLL